MSSLAYLGIIVFIFFTEIVRQKKTIFDFLSFFNILFCLMLPLPAFLLATNLVKKTSELSFNLNVNDVQILLAIFLGYLTIFVGFYSQGAIKYGKALKIEWRDRQVILTIAIFLLLLSTVAIHIYAAQFGGVVNAMSQATSIRTNTAEGAGPLSFFKHFMFLSYLASYLLASLILLKPRKKYRFFFYSAFVLSAINSIIAATTTGGRGHLIFYFLIFYLRRVIVSKKIPWLFTIILFMTGGLLILYGKTFFFSLSAIKDGFGAVQEVFLEGLDSQEPDKGSFLDDLVSNFSYPLYSLQAAFHTEYPQRLFVDWIYGIVAFLPERLLNVDVPDTISTLNTIYIVGNDEFEIPTGMFAFGIYSLSWLGLIIVCFSYGWIGRYLQTLLYQHIWDTSWMPFVYVMTAQMWIDYFTAGDPRIFLFADFWALFGLFILFTIGSKISLVRYSHHSKNTV